MKKNDLRPVAVHSHQVYWRGFFHRFTEMQSNNKKERWLHAVIETEKGNVSIVDLSYHSIEFLDREENAS